MKDLAAEQPQQPLFTGKILDRCADERPREKALANGIRSLSDSELLALLLGSGQPGKSAGLIIKADTIEELAAKLHLPVENLKKTIERQNQNYIDHVDKDFGKEYYRMSPIEK